MISIPCFSTLFGTRGCRVIGEHMSTCVGIAYDARTAQAVECSGCLPQPATRGLVCESCWERLQAALDLVPDLVPHMRSIERGPVPDGPSVQTSKPGSKVILPVSWIEADEVWASLRDVAFRLDPLELLSVRPGGTTANGFGSRDSIEHVTDRVQLAVDIVRASGDDVVRRDTTAQLAIAFYRRAQRAMRAFPFEEEAHPVAYATCRDCGNRTLERRPPLDHLDPITVRCIHPDCGAVFHPALVEYDLATYRASLEAAQAS